MIIKVKELRIGNYIDLHNSNTRQIFNNYLVTTETLGDIESSNYYAEPIQLTEEILLKAGFKKVFQQTQNGLCNYWQLNSKFELEQYLNTLDKFEYCGYNYITINSVHQLQNIYFALTGEELEINLTK